MSIRITSVGDRGFRYHVECDVVACITPGPSAYRKAGGRDAARREEVLAKLVASAKEEGWMTISNITDSHFCPEHRPEFYPLSFRSAKTPPFRAGMDRVWELALTQGVASGRLKA